MTSTAFHRLRWLFAAIPLLACAGSSTPGALRPFESDACTGFFDGTPGRRELWKHCCQRHDAVYWRGGARKERWAADHGLRLCVEEAKGRGVARLMHGGVRVGGGAWWPTPHRWGFGWPYGRGYAPLSAEEKRLADDLLTTGEAEPPPLAAPSKER